MEKVTKQYDMEVGSLIRGQVKKTILQYGVKRNIEISVTEAKSILSSYYVFTVTANEYQHIEFCSFIKRLLKLLEEEK